MTNEIVWADDDAPEQPELCDNCEHEVCICVREDEPDYNAMWDGVDYPINLIEDEGGDPHFIHILFVGDNAVEFDTHSSLFFAVLNTTYHLGLHNTIWSSDVSPEDQYIVDHLYERRDVVFDHPLGVAGYTSARIVECRCANEFECDATYYGHDILEVR